MKKVYKLQAIGGSIYVALPKEWLKRYNLDKGSAVEVFMDSDGGLKVLPLEKGVWHIETSKNLEIEIFVEKPAEVFSSLLTAYLRGFDLITLRLSSSNIEKEVKGVIDNAKELLLGLETVDTGSNYIVLKVLTSEDVDVEQLVRNLHKIARSMYLDSLQALEQRDVELAKAVTLRDRDINRLYFFITRSIRKRILSPEVMESRSLLKLVDMRMLIKFIESIGDEAKNAALSAIEIISKGLEVPKDYINAVKEGVAKIDGVYKTVVMKAYDKALDITELREYMKVCSLVRDTIKHLRIRVAEESTLYWFTEFLRSYENIAMNVYDILSLMPPEIASSTLFYE
jgi:phosphate uptake regulator